VEEVSAGQIPLLLSTNSIEALKQNKNAFQTLLTLRQSEYVYMPAGICPFCYHCITEWH